MVLVTTLLVMIILTLLGTAAVFTSATDLSIAGNGRSMLQGSSLAEAGLHEALARVNSTAGGRITPGVVGANPDPAWSMTILNKAAPNPATETQTLTGNFGSSTVLPFSTIVRYKKENADEVPVAHCSGVSCDADEVVRYHTNYGYTGAGVPTGAQVGQPVLEFV